MMNEDGGGWIKMLRDFTLIFVALGLLVVAIVSGIRWEVYISRMEHDNWRVTTNLIDNQNKKAAMDLKETEDTIDEINRNTEQINATTDAMKVQTIKDVRQLQNLRHQSRTLNQMYTAEVTNQ